MSAKYRITVNLEKAEYDALQKIANSSDRSLAWLGRKAICDLIDMKERAEVPLLAAGITRNTDVRQSAQ